MDRVRLSKEEEKFINNVRKLETAEEKLKECQRFKECIVIPDNYLTNSEREELLKYHDEVVRDIRAHM